MPRSSVAICAVALQIVAACAGSQRAPLDAHGIALADQVTNGAGANASARVVDAAATKSGKDTSVPADHLLEVRLRRELREKRLAGGTSALELVEPGATVETRLRFALSRRLLGRDSEAIAALDALTKDVAGCALAWFLLGEARAEGGDARAAVACYRQARAIESERGLPPHPALNFVLGHALLQADERDEGERLLRQELASGANRVGAAELLAQVHGDLGDFETALACLDAVLDEVSDEPSLVLIKAELLADQMRYDDALAELTNHGRRVAPVLLLYRRALLHRQRGESAAALALLDEILSQHGDRMAADSLTEVKSVRAEVVADQQGGVRTRKRERELLGVLRYAEQPAERVWAVRVLCSNARPSVVPAAVRWALLDPHDAVRISAIQTGAPRCENPAELLASGMRDTAASVRSAAAVVAARYPARDMLPPLVVAIEGEADPDAFRTMHRALTEMSRVNVSMPFGGESDPETRARVAQQWRAHLERTTKEKAGS